jgi:hypothetical protein
MEQEYSKEFFWKTYEKLPEDLKEAVFSEKNNQTLEKICAGMGLDEEQTSVVAKYTGRVLMGLLPFKEFPITLELELNVDEQTANKLAREINLAIFKDVRVSLDKIHEEKEGHVSNDANIKKDDIIKEGEDYPQDPYREPF